VCKQQQSKYQQEVVNAERDPVSETLYFRILKGQEIICNRPFSEAFKYVELRCKMSA
jgi:hypothetical protein